MRTSGDKEFAKCEMSIFCKTFAVKEEAGKLNKKRKRSDKLNVNKQN